MESEPTNLLPETAEPTLIEPAAVVPGGPGFYAQNALAFRIWPDQSMPFSYSGVKLTNPGSVTHYYAAPVALPNGATITRLVVWYQDNHASYEVEASLARCALDQVSGISIATVKSSGASTSVRFGEDTTITYPKVDLQSYSYWVSVYLPPTTDVGILSFRIDYAYATALPLVTRQ